MMKLKKTADFAQNTHDTEQKKDEPKKLFEPRLQQAEIKNMQAKKRQQQSDLQDLKKNGIKPLFNPSLPNRISDYRTVAEEEVDRRDTTLEQTQIIRAQLPVSFP